MNDPKYISSASEQHKQSINQLKTIINTMRAEMMATAPGVHPNAAQMRETNKGLRDVLNRNPEYFADALSDCHELLDELDEIVNREDWE